MTPQGSIPVADENCNKSTLSMEDSLRGSTTSLSTTPQGSTPCAAMDVHDHSQSASDLAPDGGCASHPSGGTGAKGHGAEPPSAAHSSMKGAAPAGRDELLAQRAAQDSARHNQGPHGGVPCGPAMCLHIPVPESQVRRATEVPVT